MTEQSTHPGPHASRVLPNPLILPLSASVREHAGVNPTTIMFVRLSPASPGINSASNSAISANSASLTQPTKNNGEFAHGLARPAGG